MDGRRWRTEETEEVQCLICMTNCPSSSPQEEIFVQSTSHIISRTSVFRKEAWPLCRLLQKQIPLASAQSIRKALIQNLSARTETPNSERPRAQKSQSKPRRCLVFHRRRRSFAYFEEARTTKKGEEAVMQCDAASCNDTKRIRPRMAPWPLEGRSSIRTCCWSHPLQAG